MALCPGILALDYQIASSLGKIRLIAKLNRYQDDKDRRKEKKQHYKPGKYRFPHHLYITRKGDFRQESYRLF
jgi:hypothetical protein